MTITYFTRYTTHHVISWCQQLYSLSNGKFRIVETEAFPSFRLEQGYEDWAKRYDWIINAVTDINGVKEASRLAVESDVVIFGGGSYHYQNMRVENTNRLSFKMKERLYKDGFDKMTDPNVMMDMHNKHGKFVNANLYYLCAGTYTAYDVHYQGFEPHRLLKWGYFPPTTLHSDDFFVCKDKKEFKLLWVGNMEPNKQPLMILPVLKSLREKGYAATLTYIGSGELYDSIQRMVCSLNLQNAVSFQANMPWYSVREVMKNYDINLCTSNYAEGWGAVISESMNEGCITVASYASGASCYLIEHGKNGFLFEHDDPADLEEVLTHIFDKYAEMTSVRIEAYKTLTNQWTGKEAGERLYNTIVHLLAGNREPLYKSGICSQAPLLFDSKDYKTLK